MPEEQDVQAEVQAEGKGKVVRRLTIDVTDDYKISWELAGEYKPPVPVLEAIGMMRILLKALGA
jgi:hypothetical protein